MSAHGLLGGPVDFRRLDALATADSPVHRLDARAKVIVTAAFVVCVMSFDRHAVAPLLGLAVYPFVAAAPAGIPAQVLLQRPVPVLPLALLIGLPNP